MQGHWHLCLPAIVLFPHVRQGSSGDHEGSLQMHSLHQIYTQYSNHIHTYIAHTYTQNESWCYCVLCKVTKGLTPIFLSHLQQTTVPQNSVSEVNIHMPLSMCMCVCVCVHLHVLHVCVCFSSPSIVDENVCETMRTVIMYGTYTLILLVNHQC